MKSLCGGGGKCVRGRCTDQGRTLLIVLWPSPPTDTYIMQKEVPIAHRKGNVEGQTAGPQTQPTHRRVAKASQGQESPFKVFFKIPLFSPSPDM